MQRRLLGYFNAWSATNRYIKAMGRNPVEPLGAELKQVGSDPARRKIVWPLSLRVGQV